ncbi:hypothetical protein BMW23_0651 [Bodo saltans virus]|uniref:Uncharacterized protein n=1 Tax=Bodo saltans virus TaxID=2024608 RepID=A0A2H4UV08_9VIRU|nr:hypothetical protein QJ851_gp0634 [Bodo saltans virus]ATZ80697.1 hypothetical protein BMW23_0651 [Bodo saltans virus]
MTSYYIILNIHLTILFILCKYFILKLDKLQNKIFT